MSCGNPRMGPSQERKVCKAGFVFMCLCVIVDESLTAFHIHIMKDRSTVEVVVVLWRGAGRGGVTLGACHADVNKS